MSDVFVTATDTGVGKTYVSAALAAGWHGRGESVGVFKPFACGSWEDTDRLIRAAGGGQSRRSATPFYFDRPLAPVLKTGVGEKSVRAGTRWLPRLKAALAEVRKRFGRVVVEGVGGALVPLWERKSRPGYCAADWMAELGIPVWVVARPGLGTLNHTLLTLEALAHRGVAVRRVVLSGFRGKDPAEKSNGRVLRRWTGLPVTVLPWGPERRAIPRLLRAWDADFGGGRD